MLSIVVMEKKQTKYLPEAAPSGVCPLVSRQVLLTFLPYRCLA